MVVYLDGIIGLNFLVDLMLLLGVNRLSGYPPGIGRAAAAAAVGGGYAGMCLVPSFRFLGSNLWRVVSLAVMSMAAFGMDRSAWSRGILFVMLSMALGGLVLSFDTESVPGLLLCGAALWLLCRMGFRGKAFARKLMPVEITYGQKQLRLLALRDTGNTLRDPLTGEGVMVLHPDAAWQLMGVKREELADPVKLLLPGMRLIPSATIHGTGLLLAVRCERVLVDGKESGKVVAFASEPFGTGEYQALIGG